MTIVRARSASTDRTSSSDTCRDAAPDPDSVQLRAAMCASSSRRRRNSGSEAARSCSTGYRASTVWRSSASCSATAGSSGGRTGGSRLDTARARSAAANTPAGLPDSSARETPSSASRRPCTADAVRRSTLPNRAWYPASSRSAPLIRRFAAARSPARGVHPGRDVVGVQPDARRVVAARRPELGQGARGGADPAGRELGLGGDQRGGVGGQPQPGRREFGLQPAGRADEPAPRPAGGEVSAQQDELGRARPLGVAAAAEAVPGPRGEPPARGDVAREEGALGASHLHLALVLGQPVGAERPPGLGQHVVRLAGQPGLDEDAGPVERPDAQ